MTDSESASTSAAKAWLWFGVKWGLCLLVLGFVSKRAWALSQEADWSRLEFHGGWLAMSSVCYILGWLPSVWFWRRMMKQVGGKPTFAASARAYYCGHLGKYVPGKATVLVIRSALLKHHGSPVSVSVLTATCETLMMMATGAALAVALLPWLIHPDRLADWPDWFRAVLDLPAVHWMLSTAWLPAAIVIAVSLVLSPIIASFLTLLAVKFTPQGMMGGEKGVAITPKLLWQGLATFVASWLLHGLSFGFTLRAVGVSVSWSAWPVWTGGVSGATAAGFAALFAPGGLGVREGLLMAVLKAQPGIDSGQIVIAPLLLRAVWFLSEIGIAAALYYGIRPKSIKTESPNPAAS